MIHLPDDLFIGSGRMRDCYLHPDNPDLLIKVRNGHCPEGKDPNGFELAHWERIRRVHGKLPGIIDCHGYVETDRGTGLVVDCVRNHDGSLAPPLAVILDSPRGWDLERIRAGLAAYLEELVNRNIQLFDLNAGNLVIRKGENGTLQPVSIDLKGPYDNHEFIPVSTHIPWFSRRKIARRAKRLLALFDERTSQSRLPEK